MKRLFQVFLKEVKRARVSKRFRIGVATEGIAAVLKAIFESLPAWAWLSIGGLGIVLILLHFFQRSITTEEQLVIPDLEVPRRRVRWPKWAWAVVVAAIVAVPTMVLAKYGQLPIARLEGRFKGDQALHEFEGVIVLLYADGLLPIQWTRADRDGRFWFTGLRKRSYKIVAFRLVGNQVVEIKEFEKDLQDDRMFNWKFLVRQDSSCDRYSVVLFDKCKFDTDKFKPDDAATAVVTTLAGKVPASGYRVMVFGHADETGGEDNNKKLSQKRTTEVYARLVENDVNGKRAILGFFGSEWPAKHDDSADALSANRRTEIYVLVRLQEAGNFESKEKPDGREKLVNQ